MRINPKVVDLSHYDVVEVTGTDWTGFAKLRAAGYGGVINKASQGRQYVDPSYARRRQPAIDAGLLWGAYHFLDGSNPEAQASHFLEVVHPDSKTLLALDHETPGVPLSNARLFLEYVHNEIGRYPWLYSGFLIKQQLGDARDPFWAQIKLWLADYRTNPTWPPCWDKPTLWQFTGDGAGQQPHDAPGISIPGGADINSFDGTDEELAALWAA